MALLWTVGTVLVALASLVGPAGTPRVLGLGIAGAAGLVAAVALVIAHRLRAWMAHVACATATGMVSLLVFVSGETFPFGLLYLFVTIFAFAHYALPRALAHLAAIAAAATMALVPVADPALWTVDLPMLVGVATTTGFVIHTLTARIRTLAHLDPLTGAANRLALTPALVAARRRARRHGNSLTVIMLDLDGFKAYNDTRGHTAGDQYLRDAVTAWSRRLAPSDTLVRTGGDEFAVVLGRTPPGGADALAGALAAETPAPVSVCVGICECDVDETDARILERADAALYDSKRQGGGHVTRSVGHHSPGPDGQAALFHRCESNT